VATNTNAAVEVSGGSDYAMTGAYAQVDFGGTDLEVTLAAVGTYLVMVRLEYNSTVNRGWSFKLFNSTTALDVPNSEADFNTPVVAFTDSHSFHALVTTVGVNEIIQIYGITSGVAGTQDVLQANSRMTYIRLA
jgi:hypothetical protein